VQQLEQARLEMLVGGARDMPARQRTLRATLDWSCALLPPEAQTLLARLSVFAGGWTLEAAVAVCGSNELEVLPLLEQLVEHHLVQVIDSETGRARMLETVRAYASERLRERGEEAQLRLRHATYMTELAEKSEPALYGPQAPDVLRRLRAELDNIRAALAWTLEQQPELAGRLCIALFEFWWSSANRLEGTEWVNQALARRDEMSPLVRGRLALVAGAMLEQERPDPAIEALYHEASSLLKTSDDLSTYVFARCDYARYLGNTGDNGHSETVLAGCQTMLHQLESPRIHSWWHLWCGWNAFDRGQHMVARQHWEHCARLMRQIGYIRGQAMCELALAELDYRAGDFAAAHRRNWRRLALEQSIDNQAGVANSYVFLGCLALAQAHLDEAAVHFEAALRLVPRMHQHGFYEWLCYIAGLRGDAEAARQAWTRAWPAGQVEQDQRGLLIQLACAAAVLLAEGRLDAAARLAAFVEQLRSHQLTQLWHAGPDRDPWCQLLRERMSGDVERVLATESSLTWEAATEALQHWLSVQPDQTGQ
jgi:tetratricopeptide (TPR) repeat protein